MRIGSVITALGLAAMVFALPAGAQTAGVWYMGFNAGQSKYNVSCSVGPCDNKGAGYKLWAGVALHPNVAIEGGYGDMGKTTNGASNIRATMWEITGVGTWWIKQFGVFGRLGAYTGDLKSTTPSSGAELKHGTTDLTYGIGGQMNLSRNLGARAEWQRYSGMGGGGFGTKSDVDLLSVGVLYRFR